MTDLEQLKDLRNEIKKNRLITSKSKVEVLKIIDSEIDRLSRIPRP